MFNALWKHSRIRFYILNTIWNYKFWIFSKKVFKTVTHTVINKDSFEMDLYQKVKPQKKTITSKRFSGYLYKGNIYHDNPGLQNIDSETWQAWRKKGLID